MAARDGVANGNGAASLKLEVLDQRNRLINVERAVDHLGQSMVAVDAKLDTVVTALTAIKTREELNKPVDLMRLMSVAVAAIAIFSASVGGITYVINAVNAEGRVSMRKDIDLLQMRIDRGWGIGPSSMQIRVRPE
jgi:hypothetical protein